MVAISKNASVRNILAKHILTGGSSLGLFGIAAVTAACVYLADVRPAVREAGSGGSRNVGPYGPW